MDDPSGVVETTVRDGVLRVRRPGARWLSTGANGGRATADAAYNVTVPEGWPETDLAAYARERRERAGFRTAGPALFTGVAQEHARVARAGRVAAVATAGLSNPAGLPTGGRAAVGGGSTVGSGAGTGPGSESEPQSESGSEPEPEPDPQFEPESPSDRGADAGRGTGGEPGGPPGTVNLFVATDRALGAGALANLATVAAEAKAATLLAAADAPGTTTDAVVVGCDPDGGPAAFSGSGTAVGAAARACVRDAVRASLAARYGDDSPPSVAAAEHGVVTAVETAVSPAGGGG